jgi:hypothetical protein
VLTLCQGGLMSGYFGLGRSLLGICNSMSGLVTFVGRFHQSSLLCCRRRL